jgi:hypothetical protein
MNVHTIAVLFTLLGLAFVVYCVIQAEVCYRQVERYLAEQATQRAAQQAEAQEAGARETVQ